MAVPLRWSSWLCPQSSSWPWVPPLVLMVMWCRPLVPRLAVGAPRSLWWPCRDYMVPPRSSLWSCGAPWSSSWSPWVPLRLWVAPWSSLWLCGAPQSLLWLCGASWPLVPTPACPCHRGCSPARPLVPCLVVGAPQSSWWLCGGHVAPPLSSRLHGVPPAHCRGCVKSPQSSLWSWCPPHARSHCCGCLPLILEGVDAYVRGVHPSVMVVVVVLW